MAGIKNRPALSPPHDFMTCEGCQKETYRARCIHSKWLCEECYGSAPPQAGVGLVSTIFIDKKNGVDSPIRTSAAEISHIKNFKMHDHNGKLGY